MIQIIGMDPKKNKKVTILNRCGLDITVVNEESIFVEK